MNKKIFCECGGIIGVGTVTIDRFTGKTTKNKPRCSKCKKIVK